MLSTKQEIICNTKISTQQLKDKSDKINYIIGEMWLVLIVVAENKTFVL